MKTYFFIIVSILILSFYCNKTYEHQDSIKIMKSIDMNTIQKYPNTMKLIDMSTKIGDELYTYFMNIKINKKCLKNNIKKIKKKNLDIKDYFKLAEKCS